MIINLTFSYYFCRDSSYLSTYIVISSLYNLQEDRRPVLRVPRKDLQQISIVVVVYEDVQTL